MDSRICRTMCRLALILAVCCTSLASAQTTDHRTEIDLGLGKTVYVGYCARCHGVKGDGGTGPSLTRAVLPNAPDLDALIRVIRFGIPGTGMPGGGLIITEPYAIQVAHYVKTMGVNVNKPVTGNPATGSQVFDKGDCSTCHIVNGYGTSLGPELSNVGTQRGLAYLRTAIRHPADNMTKNLRGFKTFLIVRIETEDGQEVRGVRINEDTLTIQIRDVDKTYHSFRKQDVKAIHREPAESMMPSYGDAFSPEEIDDLVAYLASMRGGK
ncbi:MAG: c-type cytochrome [Gemmatimonadota bacterium]|nr:c-type cytochrome [Gemmatimonadota bacterium]